MATAVSSIMMIAGALSLVLAILGAIHPRLTIPFWKVRSRKSAFLFYLAACLMLTIVGSQIYSTTPEAKRDRQARADAEARAGEAEQIRQEAERVRQEQIADLVRQADALPESETVRRLEIFRRLVELDPKNATYQHQIEELSKPAHKDVPVKATADNHQHDSESVPPVAHPPVLEELAEETVKTAIGLVDDQFVLSGFWEGPSVELIPQVDGGYFLKVHIGFAPTEPTKGGILSSILAASLGVFQAVYGSPELEEIEVVGLFAESVNIPGSLLAGRPLGKVMLSRDDLIDLCGAADCISSVTSIQRLWQFALSREQASIQAEVQRWHNGS